MSARRIPLLSGKPIEEFSPEEYKVHVRGLFAERMKRKGTAPKKKKLKDKKVTIKLTKKGGLLIRTKRDPKYFTAEELTAGSAATGLPESEIFIALKSRGYIQATHNEAEAIKKEINDLPGGAENAK